MRGRGFVIADVVCAVALALLALPPLAAGGAALLRAGTETLNHQAAACLAISCTEIAVSKRRIPREAEVTALIKLSPIEAVVKCSTLEDRGVRVVVQWMTGNKSHELTRERLWRKY